MKHGWEYKKIKDVCTKGSSNLQQNKIVELNGDYPVFGASGFVQNIDTYQQERPYIGIVKDGSGVGRVNTYPAKSSLLGTMQYIIPNNNINLGYVAYCLQSLKLSKFASGAAIPHIYFRDYGETYIPVPPLPVQEDICSLLDKMNRVIEGKKEQLKELDNLAQAIFYDMFGDPAVNEKGWDMKVLEELLKIPSRNGLTKPTAIRGAGVPMISMGEMFANPIITDKVEASLVPVTQRELDSSQVISGDLLFARQSLSLEGAGKCSYVKSCQNPTVFESHLIRIRVDDKIVLPKYVYSFFRTNSGITEIRKRVYQVAAAGIKGSELIKIPIPVPHLSLQQLFVERVEAIEKQKELINQSIKEVQTLFDAKMDYYFGD